MSIKIQGKTCLVLSHWNDHLYCDAVENELNISNKGEEKSVKNFKQTLPSFVPQELFSVSEVCFKSLQRDFFVRGKFLKIKLKSLAASWQQDNGEYLAIHVKLNLNTPVPVR